jgi:hypothetical protein
MNLNKATLDLDRRQIVKLGGARGAQLTCKHGLLWVTQEGLARDDFLAPGCSVEIQTDGAVLIEALSTSSAAVDVETHPARQPARLERTSSAC